MSASSANHPVFAFFYDRIARSTEAWEAKYRGEVCAQARGLVLEVGAGTGLNFVHYDAAERVVACEPEPNMLRRASARALGAATPVELVRASAERLPFDDGTFDTVTSTLVLCSVADLAAAIGEIRRVLRPGGRVRLYEHVRADRPEVARWQDRIQRPWGFFAAGCHPNRDTLGAFIAEGFRLRFRRFTPPVAGGWLLPHVVGEAR